MANTANLGFDLLDASQAQKHVTVNEALGILDAMCQPVLQSLELTVPPAADTGGAYGVPSGATGEWEGQAGRIAVASNGGWLFLTPRAGWTAWVADAGAPAWFDGTRWHPAASAVSPHGAASLTEIVEFEHAVTAGQTNQTAVAIPAGVVVIGVSGRVIQGITGQATGWQLGVSGSANRYGSSLGVAAGSIAMGLTGQPQAYYSATPLQLTAEGGAFSSGRVRFAIHLLRLTPPKE